MFQTQKRLELGLAPMEGVTDFPTRLWFCLTAKPDFALTPFLRVTANYPVKRIPQLYCPEIGRSLNSNALNVIPQLMGSSSDDLARIAEPLLTKTSFVDINCGCPAPTVVGNGAGSALLTSQKVFHEFLTGLHTSVGSKQLSIKMRTGFYDESEFEGLLEAMQFASWAQLTVHGRTRADRYKGKARWQVINKALLCPVAPVVGSGDICSVDTLKSAIKECPTLEKVIIGRGALRNPWIFSELSSKKKVTISLSVLTKSLAVFALIQELSHVSEPKLLELYEQGCFSEECFTHLEKWESVYQKVCLALYDRNVEMSEIVLSRGSFSKVKMLWCYLRTSLPPVFFAPVLLRSANFPEFLSELNEKAMLEAEEKKAPELLFELTHDVSRDWIFSGEKNESISP